jgi:hypothetical protein
LPLFFQMPAPLPLRHYWRRLRRHYAIARRHAIDSLRWYWYWCRHIIYALLILLTS